MTSKSLRDSVLGQIKKRSPERLFHDLQFNAFAIQPIWYPAGKSLKITEDFFKNIILPLHKTPVVRKLDQKLRDFCCIAANLSYTSKRIPLMVPLGSNEYNKDSFPSRYVIDLVKILTENGYITKHTGYYASDNPSASRITRICPTEKLKNELFYHKDIADERYQVIENRELVIQRDSDKKKTELKFRQTKFTNQLKKDIQLINEVNRRYSIEHSRPERPAFRLISDLHSVFNNATFEDGGRFYTGRNGYQGLNRLDRPEITFNGKKTVELDYSGFHPYMLYAKIGIQADGDQYDLVSTDKELRPVLKNALLALLNAESENEMISAGNNFLHENHDYYDIMKEKGLSIKDLLQHFKEKHSPIAQFFCTGQGVKLMNIDAEIARSILLFYAKRNEACLCIHDSFIVEEKSQDILNKVMDKYYTEVIAARFKHDKIFTCPVTVSSK